MKRIAMIRNSIVENISLWDETAPWNPGSDFTLVEILPGVKCEIGYTYSGGVFTP